jgi:ABC-2 type transport system permease protein
MQKTLLVMQNEIRATLSRKTFTIFAFGVPLLVGIAVLVIMFINRDAGPSSISGEGAANEDRVAVVAEGYVDEGGLVKALPPDVPDDAFIRYRDEAAAADALKAGKIRGYFIIPVDYVETGKLDLVRSDFNPLSDEGYGSERMEWVLLYNLFGADEAVASRARRPLDVYWQRVPSPNKPAQGSDSESWVYHLLPNLMAFALYIVIIMPSSTLVVAVTDEKKNRVMEVLVTSLSAGQLIGGKIVALGLLGLLQIALWVGVLWAVLTFGGQPLNIPPGFVVPTELLFWIIVYALLGYGMYGAQMAGLGALVPDIKDSRGASVVILVPLIVVYVFLAVIVEMPNSVFAVAMSFFPLTSPVAMIARMAATDIPTWQPALAAILQLLTAIAIVRLVARLFRAQILLSGQRFSLSSVRNALMGQA